MYPNKAFIIMRSALSKIGIIFISSAFDYRYCLAVYCFVRGLWGNIALVTGFKLSGYMPNGRAIGE